MIYIDETNYYRVFNHFQHPRNLALTEDLSHYHTLQLGDINIGYLIHWFMLYENDIIIDVKYKVYGCAFQIACCSLLSEYLKHHNISILSSSLSQMLIDTLELPREKWQCAYVCEDICKAILCSKS